MAELDVQPKKKSPWWIWLLIGLVILGLIFFLRGCNKDESETNDSGASVSDSTAQLNAVTVPNWDDVDFRAAETSYDEITDTSISVRGDDRYTIYGLGENILFATGKSAVQGSAEAQLKQISASLEKRFNGSSIAVYGNTDSTGSADVNKELGEERAESVKEWLVKNAHIPEDKISVHSKGQSDPVASNATAGGRQLNRRVEIVAMAQNK